MVHHGPFFFLFFKQTDRQRERKKLGTEELI